MEKSFFLSQCTIIITMLNSLFITIIFSQKQIIYLYLIKLLKFMGKECLSLCCYPAGPTSANTGCQPMQFTPLCPTYRVKFIVSDVSDVAVPQIDHKNKMQRTILQLAAKKRTIHQFKGSYFLVCSLHRVQPHFHVICCTFSLEYVIDEHFFQCVAGACPHSDSSIM